MLKDLEKGSLVKLTGKDYVLFAVILSYKHHSTSIEDFTIMRILEKNTIWTVYLDEWDMEILC